MNRLAAYSDHAYALLRAMAGAMFFFHGAQKIFGFWGALLPPVGSQLWVGGLLEVIAGLMILVGFQTRWAAFLSSGEMAVAYIQYHWKFRLGKEFFPAINKGELAVLYCFVFLLLASRGGVKWCLDRKN